MFESSSSTNQTYLLSSLHSTSSSIKYLFFPSNLFNIWNTSLEKIPKSLSSKILEISYSTSFSAFLFSFANFFIAHSTTNLFTLLGEVGVGGAFLALENNTKQDLHRYRNTWIYLPKTHSIYFHIFRHICHS